jgi:hypothetical protein
VEESGGLLDLPCCARCGVRTGTRRGIPSGSFGPPYLSSETSLSYGANVLTYFFPTEFPYILRADIESSPRSPDKPAASASATLSVLGYTSEAPKLFPHWDRRLSSISIGSLPIRPLKPEERRPLTVTEMATRFFGPCPPEMFISLFFGQDKPPSRQRIDSLRMLFRDRFPSHLLEAERNVIMVCVWIGHDAIVRIDTFLSAS